MKSRKSRRRQVRRFFLDDRPRPVLRKEKDAVRVLQVLAEIGNTNEKEGSGIE